MPRTRGYREWNCAVFCQLNGSKVCLCQEVAQNFDKSRQAVWIESSIKGLRRVKNIKIFTPLPFTRLWESNSRFWLNSLPLQHTVGLHPLSFTPPPPRPPRSPYSTALHLIFRHFIKLGPALCPRFCRYDLLQAAVRGPDQPGSLPRLAGRPSQPHHLWTGGCPQKGKHRGVPLVPAPGHRQLQGACRKVRPRDVSQGFVELCICRTC